MQLQIFQKFRKGHFLMVKSLNHCYKIFCNSTIVSLALICFEIEIYCRLTLIGNVEEAARREIPQEKSKLRRKPPSAREPPPIIPGGVWCGAKAPGARIRRLAKPGHGPPDPSKSRRRRRVVKRENSVCPGVTPMDFFEVPTDGILTRGLPTDFFPVGTWIVTPENL